ncbi:hypothetical protein CLOSYM_03174 [[Clostridium] symbiosum ATCC 14940]|uniref:Glucose/Sorbosone dehydrogenase domain-containing protein n=1 Tax=[Clostridium] symbiosum ATCC 14940 TaxID=411472 RepID=A0ABC9TVM7_CLOSY|nr:hypothetical protein CLOSYM_03174 [[Clostridium] symbiosum ATCC 14940]
MITESPDGWKRMSGELPKMVSELHCRSMNGIEAWPAGRLFILSSDGNKVR